jgi:outer membrane protein OmpA-like peptidoglycan-associated protein
VEPPPPPPPDPELPPSCEGEDCPDQQRRPAHVEVKGQKLVLSERIFFDFDRDTIKPISFPVLDEVVRVLKARPDIKRMRVEGHTDNKGTDQYNLDLSRRRAQSVMVYLVEHGIEPWRLSSAGFGLRCPIMPNDTSDRRAQNRRVDFIITEQEGVTLDPPKCPLSLISR